MLHSPNSTPSVKGGPPSPQTGEDWEDRVFALADEIVEKEDVPYEYAYRLAVQRLQALQEARQ